MKVDFYKQLYGQHKLGITIIRHRYGIFGFISLYFWVVRYTIGNLSKSVEELGLRLLN